MNSINITVELSAEDRARLDRILEALQAGGHAQVASEAQKQELVKPVTETAPQAAPVAPAEPDAQATQTSAVAKQTEIQLTDIQNLVLELVTHGKKAEARAIVLTYAERVTAIPAAKFAEVYNKLKALQGGKDGNL